MSSPFKIFRRHEKLLMVVATGLAMISFVFLGAIGDNPSNMPTTLVVLLVASLAGCIGWLIGLQAEKSSEWGISGIIIGALLGMLITVYTKEANAVAIGSGGLTSTEISELRNQRIIANRFMQAAVQQSGQLNPQAAEPYMFGFFSRREISIEDLVLGELLRKEADELGVVITDDAVTDLIKKASSDKMTADAFSKIRNNLAPTGGKVTEKQLLESIKSEMKANEARKLLFTQSQLTLENYWDFYEKVSVRQSAEVAAIPVSSFIDETAEPIESELQELFIAHRGNIPNFNEEGRSAEGRPGFLQPRRIKLGYLEAVYEEIEPLAGTVTDEEIQKEYEERYLRQMPAEQPASNEDLLNSGPLIPEMKLPKLDAKPEAKEDAEKTEPETTDAPKSDSDKPAAESKEEMKKDAEVKDPAVEETEKPEKSEEAKPEAIDEADKTEAKEENSTSFMLNSSKLQTVAFFQEETAEEAKPDDAEAKPQADEEKPAAEVKPAAEEKPAAEATGVVPPAPEDQVRPLDDDLKMELRDDILRRKTQTEIQKRIGAAFDFLSRISYNMLLENESENYITLEEAKKQIAEYAEKSNLVYIETPLLSQQEMRISEDYPIGLAVTALGNRQLVTNDLFQTAPTNLYTVNRADRFTTDSAFAYWKLEDKEAYSPETMEDEAVREQVIKAWRLQQALPKAQARADELAKKAKSEEADSMSKLLAETTVTGTEGGLFIEVRETGDFTWMQRSSAAPTGLGQEQPARPSVIPGVEDAGERFFKTVFNELSAKDVGVAPNRDNSVLYVTRIKERYPSNDAEVAKLRESFLSDMQTRERTKQLMRQITGQDMPDTYSMMEYQEYSETYVDWSRKLMDKYNVEIYQES